MWANGVTVSKGSNSDKLRTFCTTDVSDQTLRTRFLGHFGPDFGTYRTIRWSFRTIMGDISDQKFLFNRLFSPFLYTTICYFRVLLQYGYNYFVRSCYTL
jgi:hypothetical protein